MALDPGKTASGTEGPGEALLAAYAAERQRLTLTRVRWATALAFVPISVSATINYFVFQNDRLGEHLATHAVEASICLVVFLLARVRGAERRGIGLALGLVLAMGMALFWALSLSARDIDVLVGPITGIMIGSTLVFPWGVWPQVLVSSYIAAGYLLLPSWPATDAARLFNVMLGIGVGVLLSITGAFVLDRQRRATFVERERVAALARQSEFLVDVGRELNGTLELGDLVARITESGRRLVGADTAALTLLDDGRAVYRTAAVSPPLAGLQRELASLEFPAEEVEPYVGEIARRGVLQLPDGSSLDLLHEVNRQSGYGRTLYATVKRDGRALGFLSFLKHDGEQPFTAYQARFAEGIAHQAAIALANARLFDDLQTANRAKSEFVSTMSHELRTPLHVIMGYTEMLEDLPEEERRQAIDKIRAASRELLDLIETTLDLSRMEARRDPPTFEPLRVGDLWEELTSEFAALPRTSGLALCWECADGAALRTDRRKLKTILKNLVGNALKFTPSGEVVVTCRPNGSRVVFAVRDTGVGIDPAHLPVIFDMFRQVDSSDSRSYSGAGLGLYIVRRLVDQLGGEIAVDSAPGRGSTFTVTLPLAGGPRAATRAAA